MEKILFHYPTSSSYSNGAFALLSFDELRSLQPKIREHFKNDEHGYHATMRNLYTYLLRYFPERFTVEEIDDLKVKRNDHRRAVNDINKNIKENNRNVHIRGSIEKLGKMSGPTTRESVSIPKPKEDEVYVVSDNGKTYKIRMNDERLRFFKELVQKSKKDIKEIREEFRVYKTWYTAENVSLYKFIDVLYIYVSCISLVFGFKENNIKNVSVVKNGPGNTRIRVSVVKNDGETLDIIPDSDVDRFYGRFDAILGGKTTSLVFK